MATQLSQAYEELSTSESRFHALADQRLREIQATAELQLKVLNERVQFLEEATGSPRSVSLREPFLGNRLLDIRVFPIPERRAKPPNTFTSSGLFSKRTSPNG